MTKLEMYHPRGCRCQVPRDRVSLIVSWYRFTFRLLLSGRGLRGGREVHVTGPIPRELGNLVHLIVLS